MKTVGAVVFLAFGLTLAHATPTTLSQQAEQAWQEREKPGKTEEAIKLWEKAAKAEPNRDELWTKLAKAQGRAVRHAKSSAERKKWADAARASASQAVTKNPKSAEAQAALGEALGQWANAHKGVHSLSAVRKAVEALKTSISINSKYAYAHMLLAEFYRQSPSLLSVGDKNKALEHARLAVEYGPDYAINHLVLARALLDFNKKEEAIAELQRIGSLNPPPDAVPETRSDQETASEMLKSLGAEASSTQSQCGDTKGACSESKP